MARKNTVSGAARGGGALAAPMMVGDVSEVQKYGQLIPMRLGLSPEICANSAKALNQTLANTITLKDLYKKHHWQISGPTFYQLHLLFDKHYAEQSELVDEIAERIQLLGGLAVAMAGDVADLSRIERPPSGREEVSVQITRLLDAHELILRQSRQAAKKAESMGDPGTNDLLISNVVRTNELQVWFLAEHLVPLPLVKGKSV